MRILLVEDDQVLADGVTHSLRGSGHSVDCVGSGLEADQILAAREYDLVVLDIGLPVMDGFEVLTRLRRRKQPVPVLVLSANDGLDDRIRGLDLGADDYMAKPFDMPELEARARALHRRAQGNGLTDIVVGPLSLDCVGRRVLLDGRALDLSAREFGVLKILMTRAGRVVSKEQLLDLLYEWGEEASGNAIEVYMHRIRRKLQSRAIAIHTIRGLGYLLEAEQDARH